MVKKGLTVFLTVACALACAIGLSACANKAPETPPEPTVHTHNYQWHDNGDGTHKQHCTVADCGAPDINVGDHVWGTDDKCEKCKAAKPADAHVHNWSATLASDETHHWRNCTADGCPVIENSDKNGYGAHTFSDGNCSVCGREDITANFYFTEVTDGASVIGYSVSVKESARTKTELAMPSAYKGKPVVAIDEQGFESTAVKTVVIPESVKTIGDYAFWKSSVENIDIPDTVIEIGAVFYECAALKNVVIGNGIEVIPNYAFYSTPALQSVRLGDNVKTIGDFAFWKSGLRDIELPDELRSFGRYAFSETKLESIVIPDGVAEIPQYAFSKCSELRSFVPGASVTKIGTAAFEYTALTEVRLEGKIEELGGSVFNYCEHLRSVTIGSALKKYAGGCFVEDWRLIEFCNKSELPFRIGEIGEYTLKGCVKNLCGAENQKGEFKTVNGDWVFYSFGSGADRQTYLADYVGSDTSITLPTASVAGVAEYKIGTGVFMKRVDITSVVIPNGVTEIGERAFINCRALNTLSIGNDVATIRKYALSYCGLDSLTLPESVALIEGRAFMGLAELKTVEWNAVDCVAPESESLNFTTNNGYGFFSDSGDVRARDGITAVTFGAKVKTIPAYAFKYCKNLKNVTIPSSVTEIGRNAFYRSGVQNVKNSSMASKLMRTVGGNDDVQKIIGDSAFENCANLENVSIPDGIVTVGKKAFYNCAKLGQLTVPSSVTTIGENAFSSCAITELSIPDSVTDINAYAFGFCNALTDVHIGAGVSALDRYAFYGCKALKTISVAVNSVKYTSVGNCLTEKETGALVLGGNISVIPADGSIKSIGDCAFYNRSSLSEITVPDSVTDIGESAFAECGALVKANLGNGVKVIGKSAFERCGALDSITIPASVKSIGNSAFYFCRALVEIDVPDGVESIGERAFYFCGSLKRLSISKSVKSIGAMAVASCVALECVTVDSENAVYVGNGAVVTEKQSGKLIIGCKNGEIPADGSIKIIGDAAFFNYGGIASMVIPDGVTDIGNNAFYNCTSVTSVTLPASITHLGANSFGNCGALTSITFNGTKAQWNAVEKDAGWNDNCGECTVHCTDGDIA